MIKSFFSMFTGLFNALSGYILVLDKSAEIANKWMDLASEMTDHEIGLSRLNNLAEMEALQEQLKLTPLPPLGQTKPKTKPKPKTS